MQYSALLLLPVVLATNIEVSVGQGGQVFVPDKISAKAGDTITFKWDNPYHSVVQSSFDKPCIYMEGGLNSGVITMSDNAPTYVISVKNSDPLYIFCSVGKHCQNGMAMVVNEPSGKTLDSYKNAAASAPSGTVPTTVTGGQLVAPGSSPSSAVMSASSAASSMSSSAASMAGSMSSSSSVSSESSSMASGAATTSTSAPASGTSSAATTTSSTVKGAGNQHVGDVVAVFGAAALAALL